jgi:hypothetical protein
VAVVPLACRWEQAASRFVTPEGEDAVSEATIYTETPVVAGGWLLLGDPADLADDITPQAAGARRIRQTGTSPRLKKAGAAHKAFI